MMRILISAGGTGGHITGAVDLTECINSGQYLRAATNFLTTRNSRFAAMLEAKHINYSSLPLTSRAPLLSFRFLSFSLNFFRSIISSVVILRRFKPDVIVAFGSYASLPVVIANILLARPARLILHEQNMTPGQANQKLALFADKVAGSFEKTLSYFKEKGVYTGNPRRLCLDKIDRRDALAFFGFDGKKPIVLIQGGSQGASFINKFSREAVKELYEKSGGSLQVIHISGEGDYQEVKEAYKHIDSSSLKVFDFLENMAYAYKVADIALSRAGATSIYELIEARVPAVLVPYPYARAHQLQNALYLVNHEAAILYEQDKADKSEMINRLNELIVNKNRRDKIKRQLEDIKLPDSCRLLSGLILTLTDNS